MLEFASAWPWWFKAFVALAFMAPISVLIVFFEKRFSLSAERFLLAWLVGSALAFLWFAGASSSMTVTDLVRPIVPFLLVVILGVLLGGMGNVLVAQSISQASNPALPWGIIAINTPIAYILAVLAARANPQLFSDMSFSWVNLFGLFVLIIGIALTMYDPK